MHMYARATYKCFALLSGKISPFHDKRTYTVWYTFIIIYLSIKTENKFRPFSTRPRHDDRDEDDDDDDHAAAVVYCVPFLIWIYYYQSIFSVRDRFVVTRTRSCLVDGSTHTDMYIIYIQCSINLIVSIAKTAFVDADTLANAVEQIVYTRLQYSIYINRYNTSFMTTFNNSSHNVSLSIIDRHVVLYIRRWRNQYLFYYNFQCIQKVETIYIYNKIPTRVFKCT